MNCKLTYTGSAPGADTNDYTLYDSVVATPAAKTHTMASLMRFYLSLLNNQAGTLKVYRTSDRVANPSKTTSTVTWTQCFQASVAAIASNTANTADIDVEPYDDFKIVWTNGGSAQTTWFVDMTLTTSRNPAV